MSDNLLLSPRLRSLVRTALEDVTPCLTPLQPLSRIPGGPHLVGMEGHRDVVSCISTVLVQGAPSPIIVTSSWDKTLKSWDLTSTGVLKTFDGHSDRVLSVALSADGVYTASGSEDKSIRYTVRLALVYTYVMGSIAASTVVRVQLFMRSSILLSKAHFSVYVINYESVYLHIYINVTQKKTFWRGSHIRIGIILCIGSHTD